jgi:hypothetical protein
MNSPCSTTPGIKASNPARRGASGYPSETGIDDPVAAIGDKNVAVLALSNHHMPGNAALRKCLADRAARRREAERNDFDR